MNSLVEEIELEEIPDNCQVFFQYFISHSQMIFCQRILKQFCKSKNPFGFIYKKGWQNFAFNNKCHSCEIKPAYWECRVPEHDVRIIYKLLQIVKYEYGEPIWDYVFNDEEIEWEKPIAFEIVAVGDNPSLKKNRKDYERSLS